VGDAYGLLRLFAVWLLLAPRDYLSTYMKIGTITLLAVAIIMLHRCENACDNSVYRRHRAYFGGKLFRLYLLHCLRSDFGFHALIASGTTPRLPEQ